MSIIPFHKKCLKGANNKNIAKQLLSHLVIQYELKNI